MCFLNLEEEFFVFVFYVLFVCIIAGPIGTYVKFFLLLDNNLLMNCKIVRMCFGCWFLLLLGVR
jgi:hypothetical protein